MLSVELHAHSAASYDGRDAVDALLERAAEVGLDALAVTDHDTLAGGSEVAAKAADYGLVGIPGIEVSSAAGHVLGLDVDEAVAPGLSFAETIERIHDAGGIAVVPHPFQEMRNGVLANVDKSALLAADAIEVYNSRLFTGWANRKAKRFATARKLPMTAGSDAHIGEMVGQAVTEVGTDDRSVEGILDALVEGKTSVVGSRTPWRISFRQFGGGVKRRIKRTVSDLV